MLSCARTRERAHTKKFSMCARSWKWAWWWRSVVLGADADRVVSVCGVAEYGGTGVVGWVKIEVSVRN